MSGRVRDSQGITSRNQFARVIPVDRRAEGKEIYKQRQRKHEHADSYAEVQDLHLGTGISF
jgi:hypothetical protein